MKEETPTDEGNAAFAMPELGEKPLGTLDGFPDDEGRGRDYYATAQQQPEPKKAPRGRKKKEAPPPKQPLTAQEKEQSARAFALGFRAVFGMIARKRGAHWNLSNEDAYSLGSAWSEALEPYMPAIAKAMPWAGAIVVTYEVVDARVSVDKLNAAKQAEVVDPTREAAARAADYTEIRT